MKVYVRVSPSAGGRLTRGEIRRVVRKAQEEAEFEPGWRPGKRYRFSFKKAGKGYAASLDHCGGELHVFVGLPQEVTRRVPSGSPDDD